jgi:predicted MFS family arabinose efflux permease
MAKGNLRAILASGGFRRLLAVRLTSQFGDGLFSGGLAGSILFNPDRQADPLAIATGFAVLLLPYSLLGPYVGVFLDRWSRRNVLVYANLLRPLVALPAAALLWTGHEGVPLAVLALVVIGVNRFILAGHSAAMPHVVDGERLVTANAAAPSLGTVVNSLALGVSALVQTFVLAGNPGYGLLAALAAVGYLTSSALAKVSFRPDQLGPDETERRRGGLAAELVDVTRGMVAGARHLARRRASVSVLGAQAAYRVLYGVLTVAALLLYRNYFPHGGDLSASIAGLAGVVVAGGAGSLLAAFITPAGTRWFGGRGWVSMLLCSAGVLVVVLGWPFSSPLLVAAVFVINIAAQGTKIVVDTTLQWQVADEYRGRVFSVNDTTYNACYVLGLFLGALVLPSDGHSPPAVIAVGLGYVLVGALYAVVSKEKQPAPEAPETTAPVGGER